MCVCLRRCHGKRCKIFSFLDFQGEFYWEEQLESGVAVRCRTSKFLVLSWTLLSGFGARRSAHRGGVQVTD